MPFSYTTYTQSKLQRLFDTCEIEEEKYAEVDSCLRQIMKGKERYHSVSHPYNIPWYLTGIMHSTVCDCDFKVHLVNGDSLNGRTLAIPVGYPKKGRPPFTWEQSAEDTFQFYRMDKWSDWSIPGMLYNLEIVSRKEHIDDDAKTSELWCFSNHYKTETTSEMQKCGAAILLRRLAEKKLVPVEVNYCARLASIKKLGSEISFTPNRSLPKVCELQRLLNLSGAYLREDGRAGRFTAEAYHSLTDGYLQGDPQTGL